MNSIKILSNDNIKQIAFNSLVFLMLVFSGMFYIIKITLVFILIFTFKKFSLSTNQKIILLLFMGFGLVGTLTGLIYCNDKPFFFSSLYLIWPFLFIFIIQHLKNEFEFKQFFKTIYYSHLFIVIYDLLYAFSTILGFSFPLIYNIDYPFSYYEEVLMFRMNFSNLNTIMWTMPTLFLLLISKYNYGIKIKYQIITMILTTLLVFISGRRALILVFFILPIISIFSYSIFSSEFRIKVKKILPTTVICVVCLIGLIYYINENLILGFWETFIKAFDSEKEPTKFQQHLSLMNSFRESPILGKGFGAKFLDPVRSYYDYVFELSYQLKLANTGLIGFTLLFSSYIILIITSVLKALKTNDIIMFVLTNAFFIILICDATNPVLTSFDSFWPFYCLLARNN